MKLFAYTTIIIALVTLPLNSNSTVIDITKHKLFQVLDFIEAKYEQFQFDGLLGVTFAHAFLIKSLRLPTPELNKQDINHLIRKCETIHRKIYPLLPDDPKYMTTFRRNLLDAGKWNVTLPDQFSQGKITRLGYYNDWTADTIINERTASYKGVKSDVCLREILEKSTPWQECFVSDICEEMMLDEARVDAGYLLTHRLLYLQVIRLHGCTLPERYWKFKTVYCSYIYKEVVTSDRLNFPHHDIFLEQVVLCGMEGFAEFLSKKWLKSITEWQDPYGCYQSVGHNVTKRTSFAVGFGCSDHTTGLGAAALALHLRYMFTFL